MFHIVMKYVIFRQMVDHIQGQYQLGLFVRVILHQPESFLRIIREPLSAEFYNGLTDIISCIDRVLRKLQLIPVSTPEFDNRTDLLVFHKIIKDIRLEVCELAIRARSGGSARCVALFPVIFRTWKKTEATPDIQSVFHK